MPKNRKELIRRLEETKEPTLDRAYVTRTCAAAGDCLRRIVKRMRSIDTTDDEELDDKNNIA